jgi:light-regulated signal transduction histidine kinase (bacteriophytochrome)
VLTEARNELEAEAHVREIQWQLSPLPAVQGDRTLLRQVFVNLLSNAIKFTRSRPGAIVEVRSAPELAQPHEAVVMVRDNGVGFDMAYADKLFGAFQRLHGIKEYPGTGIGLATAQRIVHKHGGEIWADARPGDGATFYFTLPRVEEAPEAG